MKVLTKKAEEMSKEELAAYIDHAILSPEMTEEAICASIKEAVSLSCKSVCVNPAYLKMALNLTKGTKTCAIVVCDFPFGQSTTAARIAAAEDYCRQGAAEIDIVLNYSYFISGGYDACLEDLTAVADKCHEYQVPLKVIIETDALTKDQIAKATQLVAQSGADFVKSSTGFYPGAREGATPEVVSIMLQAAEGKCMVKGSGCVRTKERFYELINLGVDRIGTGCGSTAKLLQ